MNKTFFEEAPFANLLVTDNTTGRTEDLLKIVDKTVLYAIAAGAAL